MRTEETEETRAEATYFVKTSSRDAHHPILPLALDLECLAGERAERESGRDDTYLALLLRR